MIADEIINEIRSRADIVAVIGQHVQLKKAGRNWKGLCPFHGEKTPSFNVSPDKGFFHCFGCAKHGDVFTFVMELEGKSFVEAAEQLGVRFGIEVPKVDESPELRRARGERVAMLDCNRITTTFFREMLADPKRGETARDYLAKRGVGAEISEKFQLGYAPADWHALADYLKAKGVDPELALKLGLVRKQPKAGGYYDLFRDRLVCPVIVPGGEVVGFSARVIGKPPPAADGSEPPKYINSSDSSVYKKSKLLFGLAQARASLQQNGRAVLVEGNFDVITLHQAGFTDVVAPLGTALTIEQVQTLKRLTDRIVLLYDGDRAGYKATLSSLELAFEADLEVRIAKVGDSYGLSGGVDPDGLVSGGGGEVLRDAIQNAISGFEYFCFEVWGRAKGSADARARALNDAARIVSRVTDPTKRNLIVGTIASSLEVSIDVAWEAMRTGARGEAPRPRPRLPDHPNAPQSGSIEEAAQIPPQNLSAPAIVEVELISLLTDHPTLIASPEADKAFWLLTDARLRDMYSAAREGQPFLRQVQSMAAQLPQPTIQQLLSGKYAEAKDPRGQLVAMTSDLEQRKTLLGYANLKKQLVDAQRRGDRDLARRLAQLAEAERKGDNELADRLVAEILSNRKQAE